MVLLLSGCTSEELGDLRAQVRHLDHNLREASANVKAHDKEAVAKAIKKLWGATNSADYRTNTETFRFHGEPVPPEHHRGTILSGEAAVALEIEAHTFGDLNYTETTVERTGHVNLSNVTGSLVSCSADAVNVDTVRRSLVKIAASGAVYVKNARHCLFVVDCHQLRLHDSFNCAVVGHVTSGRMVIEASRGIAVSEIAVDDFDWPTRTEQNPHILRLSTAAENAVFEVTALSQIPHTIQRLGLEQEVAED